MYRSIIHMVAVVFGVTACTAEWKIPDDYVLECEQDLDCPGEQTCNLESNSCVDPNQPICGNDVTEFGEECDAGQYNTDSYTIPAAGITPCNSSCTGPPPYCADAVVNGGEVCDVGSDKNTNAYGIAGRCNVACNGYAPSKTTRLATRAIPKRVIIAQPTAQVLPRCAVMVLWPAMSFVTTAATTPMVTVGPPMLATAPAAPTGLIAVMLTMGLGA